MWPSVATEDTRTLLDLAVDILQELCAIFDEDGELQENFRSMLMKLTSVMSDRCSVMKSFKEQLNDYRKSELGMDGDLEYLYCNAHFLLGLCTNSEKVLAELEKEQGTLGRDLSPIFKNWGSSDFCSSRFIRTASDCFGPRGDEKSGCREYWLAYCSQKGIQSRITSYRSNRSNNFYASAAALYHHRADIVDFLESNFEYSELNLKLKSVLADAKSEEIMCLTRTVGLLFYTVTSPYWTLLQSPTEHVDFHKYIQEMHGQFSQLAVDATPLMADQVQSVFVDFPVQADDVFDSLLTGPTQPDLTKKALENLLGGFKRVTEKQLADFLPNGRYGFEVDNNMRQKMKHCKLTDIIGEYNFGDLDFSLFKRRHASLHHHFTVNMMKWNKTISSWLCKKDTSTQRDLMAMARLESPALRKKHRRDIQEVQDQVKAILDKKRKEKEAEAKLAKKMKLKKDIMEAVKKNGGPCCSAEDVGQLLSRHSTKGKKREALKAEICFLKEIVGVKDPLLKLGEKELDVMEENLKVVIRCYYKASVVHIEQHEEDPSDSESDTDDAFTSDSSDDSVEESDESDSEIESGKHPKEHGASNDLEYSFERQGEWVSVYYDEGMYIGQVIEVQGPEEGSVKFLQQCNMDKRIFKWPDIDEVDLVKSIHILKGGFDVKFQITRLGQSCKVVVENIEELLKIYKEHRKLGFSTK